MLDVASGDELLRQEDVLRIIPISKRTLQRRRYDGSIKALRVNAQLYLYPRSAIDEFLAKLRSGELQTVTYDGPGHPRPKRQSPKRRERRSGKVVRLSSSAAGEETAPKRSKRRGKPGKSHSEKQAEIRRLGTEFSKKEG
jgi:hypothetical protein